MTKFFDFIYDTITSVWNFFTGFLENTLMLIEYLGVVAQTCYNVIGTMPSWLQAFGTITIIVLILYMILGRNAGGSD